jgi:integrase/recombinase XerC
MAHRQDDKFASINRRDTAAVLADRGYKRHMKVDRGLSPASVNQALAGMDHLFRFLGLGAAIVRREELPRSAPRALDVEQQRLLL